MARGYCNAIGYFFGRLVPPNELTIAFLGESEDTRFGVAAILSDIGPEHLQVIFNLLPDGMAEITLVDARDPENFSDTRKRPIEHVIRFMDDLSEDKKFVVTVGDMEMNLDYRTLRLELEQVSWITENLH